MSSINKGDLTTAYQVLQHLQNRYPKTTERILKQIDLSGATFQLVLKRMEKEIRKRD